MMLASRLNVAYLIGVLVLVIPAVANCETSAILAASQQNPASTGAAPRPVSSRRQKPFVTPTVQEADARPSVPSARRVKDSTADEGIGRLLTRAVVAIALSSLLGLGLFVRVRSSRPDALSRRSADLELVSTLSLAPRCCLSLVRVQGRSILVARDASGVKEMIVIPGDFSDYLGDDGASVMPTQTGPFAPGEV